MCLIDLRDELASLSSQSLAVPMTVRIGQLWLNGRVLERAGERMGSAVVERQVAESNESPVFGLARTADGSSESLAEFIQIRIEIPRRRTKDG